MTNKEIIDHLENLKKSAQQYANKQYQKELLKGVLFNIPLLMDFSFLNSQIDKLDSLGITLVSFNCLKNIIFTNKNKEYYMIDNHPLYQEIIAEHNKCISRIATTISENQTINPAKIAGIYHYLLKKGFFSYEHKYFCFSSGIDEAVGLTNLGLDIPTGHGVCRNISMHFRDVLQELEIINELYFLLIPHNTKIYNLRIGKNIESSLFTSRPSTSSKLTNLTGNHIINAILFNNKAYYLDLTNRSCFQKRKFHHLESYDSQIFQEQGLSRKDYTLPARNYMKPFILSSSCYNRKIEKNILAHQTASFEEINTEFLSGQLYAEENHLFFEKLFEANKESYQKIVEDLIQYEKVLNDGYSSIKAAKVRELKL